MRKRRVQVLLVSSPIDAAPQDINRKYATFCTPEVVGTEPCRLISAQRASTGLCQIYCPFRSGGLRWRRAHAAPHPVRYLHSGGRAGGDEIGRLAMVASTGDHWLIGCGIFGWRFVACTPAGYEPLNRPPHGQNEPTWRCLQVIRTKALQSASVFLFNLGSRWLFILGRTVQSGMVSEVTIAWTREDHGRRSGVARPRLRERMHAFNTSFV
jgi:hypothetical protein